MASVGAANPPAPSTGPLSSHGGIRAEDLKSIDISSLSQSELLTLSMRSSSAFDVRRTDDVVNPLLNRSVFNESAGSRRQTYSRLHHRSHSRLPGLHPSLKPHHHPQSSTDHVSHSIVHYLKHFLTGNQNPPPPPPAPPSPPTQDVPNAVIPHAVDVGFLGLQDKLKMKRKRARKSKNLNKKKLLDNGSGIELQKVNSKGEEVDFTELEKKGDELFTEELKRRTTGLETEDGILGFLWGLEGQWCSRRKKRKYVEAGMFGEALPIGWKLLLGLRRRDYRVSVYCRRYISPTGQQFLSCKEVASFLKSYFGVHDLDQRRDQKTLSIQQAYNLSSEKTAHPLDKANDATNEVVDPSNLARNTSGAHDDCLMVVENIPEVQVQDIFKCSKCNLTFDEKSVYLQHLSSFHQKTTKRYKFGAPVGEGVIIKDGKYECQFCHKVFLERRSYNGHVGIHVRNSGKNTNELVAPVNVQKNSEPPLPEVIPSRSSKMDALIEIAKNSILETSTVDASEQPTPPSANALSFEEIDGAPAKHEANLCSDLGEIQNENSDADKALGEDMNHGRQVRADHNMRENNNDEVDNNNAWNASVQVDSICMNDSKPTETCEVEKNESSSLALEYDNRCLKPIDDCPEDTPGLSVGETVFQDGVSPMSLDQSFQFFPPFDSVSNKEEHEFSVVDQKLENVTDFEELRFDDIDPYKYGFVNGQEFSSLEGGSLNLGNSSVMDDGFHSSVGFGSEEVRLGENQLTVCVWCRTEFKLDGIESEAPSDSIGYMCPTCKAKISGHFGNDLSMGPHF